MRGDPFWRVYGYAAAAWAYLMLIGAAAQFGDGAWFGAVMFVAFAAVSARCALWGFKR